MMRVLLVAAILVLIVELAHRRAVDSGRPEGLGHGRTMALVAGGALVAVAVIVPIWLENS